MSGDGTTRGIHEEGGAHASVSTLAVGEEGEVGGGPHLGGHPFAGFNPVQEPDQAEGDEGDECVEGDCHDVSLVEASRFGGWQKLCAKSTKSLPEKAN
jgi:hypothetical protein